MFWTEFREQEPSGEATELVVKKNKQKHLNPVSLGYEIYKIENTNSSLQFQLTDQNEFSK